MVAAAVTVTVAALAGAASYGRSGPAPRPPAGGKGVAARVSPPTRAATAATTTVSSTVASPAPSPAPTPAGSGAAGIGAAWVVQENAKQGTGAWALTKPARNHQIEGYADQVSIAGGGSVRLYVSTPSPTFHVEAYRMGFYGGARGRLVWTSPAVKGTAQPGFTVTPGVNTVETHWSPSLTVQTDASWTQGDYLFKLVASDGFEAYAPLTVRDDSSTAAYVVSSDVTTWQAYNIYGGYDLYNGPQGYPTRSRIVSFDRPYYLTPDGGDVGSGDFLGNEENLVALVESLGLDVTYSTDVDLHRHPDLLLHHRAFLSLGHDEYYSLAMRNALLAGIDHGVNLVFFGANAIYRHIRLEPSPLGPDRHEVDYKDANEDPVKSGPDVTPQSWRSPPNNQPESLIIGNLYQCNPVVADLVITEPGSWVFAGTGVTAGTVLPGVVGTEYDRYDPKNRGPKNVTVLAHSPLVCQGKADYADMTYYSAPSGAGVFASGTLLWIPKLAPCAVPCPGATLARITQNVLAVFGAGPAGRTHPSAANYASLPATSGSPPTGTG
ncbi:MAG: hypothetical protein NVSMB32_18470 [Actinomycetota bacterium]